MVCIKKKQVVPPPSTLTLWQGGLHRGGRGAGRPPPPPNLSIGGASPPNFRLQYKEVPKSPLVSLFCNSVYWLKPHNNVNSRPPNLEVLPPPLFGCETHQPFGPNLTLSCTPDPPNHTLFSVKSHTSHSFAILTSPELKLCTNWLYSYSIDPPFKITISLIQNSH